MSRGLKQLVYGAGYLLFFSAILYGLFLVTYRRVETCTDNRQNQTEIGIDCGGPCTPCGIKYAKSVEVGSIEKISVGSGRTVVLIYVKNPNDDYAVKDVAYTIEIKGTTGEVLETVNDHTFFYDQRTKGGRYLLVPIDVAKENVGDVSVTFQSPTVVARNEFLEPSVAVRQSSTDIAGVKRTEVPVYVFTKDIGIKAVGEDVLQLETFLVNKGFFKKTPDTTFDLDTKIALTAYQKSKKIASANGILGASTRKAINAEIDTVAQIVVDVDAEVTVNGRIKNSDVVTASNVIIVSFVYDATGLQLGASKTELNNLTAGEDRAFKVVFPKMESIASIDPTRTKLFIDAVQ